MPDVRLLVDGRAYGGWQRMRIRRSMERVAGEFELSVTERWPGQDARRPIRPGVACTVQVDAQTVITGYVDDVAVNYDKRNHTVTVSGRDRTGDLVDCSAPSVQWSGRTLGDVARQLCQPHGIRVRVDTDVGGPFERLKNNEGDSVFETLEAAARVRGVLLTSNEQGDLVIARATHSRVATHLRLGDNILAGRAQLSHRDRYSNIMVKGQTIGTDIWNTEDAAHPEGSAVDTRIRRYRPLIVMAEEQVDAAAAQIRAEWERNVRFGRSQRITYTVQGWRHSSGLWRPNAMVRVEDAFTGLNSDRLLVGVSLLLDQDGTRAELEVMPREAFVRTRLPEPGKAEEELF